MQQTAEVPVSLLGGAADLPPCER